MQGVSLYEFEKKFFGQMQADTERRDWQRRDLDTIDAEIEAIIYDETYCLMASRLGCSISFMVDLEVGLDIFFQSCLALGLKISYDETGFLPSILVDVPIHQAHLHLNLWQGEE